MKKKILRFHVYLVTVSLPVLLLLPISAMAEGDGGWTTTASPGHVFLTHEGLHNNKKHLVMTMIKADSKGVEIHWGPASGSVNSTYQLKSMKGQSFLHSKYGDPSEELRKCNAAERLWQGTKITMGPSRIYHSRD